MSSIDISKRRRLRDIGGSPLEGRHQRRARRSRLGAACAAAGTAIACALALTLVPAGGRADAAELAANAQHFSINDQARFTRTPLVHVGDHGYTPFFGPAVVVWTGGSICAGFGVPPDQTLAAQTLRAVPHEVSTYDVTGPSATIADLVAAAPWWVDRRYDPAADANICVVLGGGGDLKAGSSGADTYAALRAYCLARRAVGFRVLVVTLLPRSEPLGFEAERSIFNQLVREHWPEFADGIIDIAADPRIGDAGDNLDERFYQGDATHPNAAGYAVMGSIAAPVVNGLAWRSADCEIRIGAGGRWSDWMPYLPDRVWPIGDTNGVNVVDAEYRYQGQTTASAHDDILLDSVGPTTRTPFVVHARHGRRTTLTYRLDDATPSCGTATVTIRIARAGGRPDVVLRRRLRPVNAWGRATFTCGLLPGRYRYRVEAVDAAGNPATRIGTQALIVR